jgi:signal transduction histidine kinase
MTPLARNELLQWPTAQAAGRKILRLIRLSHRSGSADAPVERETNPIILLQWLVAIATSYLILTTQDWNFSEPFPALLVLTCLISAAAIQRIPKGLLEKRSTRLGVLLLDTVLIVAAITSPQQIPWDLLLLFFFCLFMATMGDNLIQIGIGCVLLSITFLIFVPSQAMDVVTVNPSFLIRVPFMFGISIFYGYLANELKREKKRNQRLEDSMRLKRQVVAGVAHDIKTPLNVIMGHVELLASDSGNQAMGRLSSLKCVRRNIDDIIRLLSDFLLISKLETGQSDSAKSFVEMNRIAEDVVNELAVIAREKDIRVSLDLEKGLKVIVGDQSDMHRAVSNLVSNAIKFTQPGGSVTVTSRNDKGNVSLQVKDTGPGIAKEDQRSLFSEYKRLKSAENTTGTGLGLFIVKTIVEAHGGVVEVESESGLGATFAIRIPTDRHSRKHQPAADIRDRDNGPLRVSPFT